MASSLTTQSQLYNTLSNAITAVPKHLWTPNYLKDTVARPPQPFARWNGFVRLSMTYEAIPWANTNEQNRQKAESLKIWIHFLSVNIAADWLEIMNLNLYVYGNMPFYVCSENRVYTRGKLFRWYIGIYNKWRLRFVFSRVSWSCWSSVSTMGDLLDWWFVVMLVKNNGPCILLVSIFNLGGCFRFFGGSHEVTVEVSDGGITDKVTITGVGMLRIASVENRPLRS